MQGFLERDNLLHGLFTVLTDLLIAVIIASLLVHFLYLSVGTRGVIA